MIDCPNCGTANPDSRAFCQVCGQKLLVPPPAEATMPGAGDNDMLEWLLAEAEPQPPPQPPPSAAPQAAPEAAPPAREPEAPSALPEWLRGLPITEAAAPTTVADEWDESLDFSELPDWEPDAEGSDPAERPARGTPRVVRLGRPRRREDDPIQAPEMMGSGLLAGIPAPIPVEPVINLSHQAPAFPTRSDPERDDGAANLFARIAGGAVMLEPLPVETVRTRGAGLLSLLLLVVLLVPLLIGPGWLGRPAALPAATRYWEALAALPPNSTVLLAFEYEGGMSEELTPAVLATLAQLATLEGEPTLVALSTSPQGSGLAQLAFEQSQADLTDWQRCRYLPGGALSLRALLVGQLEEEGCGTARDVALLVVIGNETSDVQRWVEQVALSQPGLPLLAIAPSAAEPSLAPYMASGQISGMLAGIPGAASYEFNGLRTSQGSGWRRLDAVTLGALLLLLAIVAGNLIRTEPAPHS